MNPEYVVQRNGQVRTAGATQADGAQVHALRARCERSLYVLSKAVLRWSKLTPTLHKPVCDWLQECPPHRKMLLMPRDHFKTTMVARSLPLHMWIQPYHHNRYFPGMDGRLTRILLAGENEKLAQANLRVVRHHLESNDLFRALWPHVCWPSAKGKTWNDTMMTIPRPQEFAEPSLHAVGVGGAITGQHPNVLMKDDITTEEAANSETVMQTAIEWHVNTRALLSQPATDLEFITATYWAVQDLPHIIEQDPSVAVNTRFRAMIENGGIIFPEKFTMKEVEQLQREFGPRFYLLYMNSVSDSHLVDFNAADLRYHDLLGTEVEFIEDDRDEILTQATCAPMLPPENIPAVDLRGAKLSDGDTQDQLRRRAYRIRPQ